MALTPEQLADRKNHLGSSEMAAVMGLDQHASAWDVWAIKTGRADGFSGNDATRRGNYLEGGLMMFAEYELGCPIERNVSIVDPGGILAVNLDGRCVQLNANVEAKSISGDINPDEWGEDEYTDIVPNRVIIQTHTAMEVSGLRVSYVPVVLPIFKRFEYRIYRVDFNPELGAQIRAAGERFWREHVMADLPPSDSVPSMEVLKRMRRTPGKVATVDEALVEAWRDDKDAEKTAKNRAAESQAALLVAMGDADGARTEHGAELTYFEQTRKEFVSKASTFRVLRLKGSKK